ncbi:MAG: hypothetical protein LBF83_01525 [Spirochaetaceae bacterium]|nr:hypothetical protein [Spirochaetaceae bacterium]
MKKKLFLALMALAAGLFAACNADSSGEAEAEILDSGPRYGISVTAEKEDSGGLVAVANTGGLVTVSPSGRVKAGATVTLSVNAALITDEADETDNSGGGGGGL